MCKERKGERENNDADKEQEILESSDSCFSCGKEWFSDKVSNQEQWLDCDQCNAGWTCARWVPKDFDLHDVFLCEICKG